VARCLKIFLLSTVRYSINRFNDNRQNRYHLRCNLNKAPQEKNR
jgi:hypothetical protein